MKVFVVNCGSSSIKYQLFSMVDETVLAKGIIERIGTNEARIKHQTNNSTGDSIIHETLAAAPNHNVGLKIILELLIDSRLGVLRDVSQIQAVGHRVVHGGEKINTTCLIDDGVIEVIEENCALSPLHNPANLRGIEAARQAMPNVPHVAVFDTAFLATLPPHAYRYAVPTDWYTRHHVRKYGFHGTSHRYVALRAAELLGKSPDAVNLITVHMGNGCSMTAVAGGKAVDHSMGMTPLDGLVMGTRSGAIDPAVPLYMIGRGMDPAKVDEQLNKASGLLGVSERSNDMRDLLSAVDQGCEKSRLAVEMFVYRIVKYIGSYYAILPGLDAIVLTGGIGENSLPVRRELCSRLARLGVVGDEGRNQSVVAGRAGPITSDAAGLSVWVVPTNEELMIARDTQDVAMSLCR